MSFDWVNPKELYLLEAFPEVIMIDTTEKNNNERRPLLIAGGKDSNGKMLYSFESLCPINNRGYFVGCLVLCSQS